MKQPVQIDHINRDTPVAEIFQALDLLDESQRYESILNGISTAAGALASSETCILIVVDDTNAGGKHKVTTLIDPLNDTAYLEIPPEPNPEDVGIKGGRFPTICHAVELIAACYAKAGVKFPALHFTSEVNPLSEIADFNEPDDSTTLLMPLTINPPNTNVLICHTQVPHIDPQQLLLGWYEVIKQDDNLVADPIRHTILVMPRSQTDEHTNEHFTHDQPASKTLVLAETLPRDVVDDRARFRPLHLNRVSRWGKASELNDCPIPLVEQLGDRYGINLGRR